MGKPTPVTLFSAFYAGQDIDSFEAEGMSGAKAYIASRYSTPELVVICPDGGDFKAAIAESLRLVPTLSDDASETAKAIPSDAELSNMNRAELAAWYKDVSGNDPLEDEPEIEFEMLLSDCKVLAMSERCGGIDSEEYLQFEAQHLAAAKAQQSE